MSKKTKIIIAVIYFICYIAYRSFIRHSNEKIEIYALYTFYVSIFAILIFHLYSLLQLVLHFYVEPRGFLFDFIPMLSRGI